MSVLIYIILVAIILFFVHKFLSQFKFPKVGAVACFTGGVKAGKSAVSLAFALSNFKRIHRGWKLRCFFIRLLNLFRKKDKKLIFPEEPFFYSSIKLRNVKYVPLTREHLLRQRRFHYGSVCFIDEASLVADSQLFRDVNINTQLLLFFKLFGHETRGGKCVFNSHCITDLHHALKRTTSEYFYVHHISRYIPFFTVCNLREERYSEDGTTVNNYGEDVETSLKKVLMLKGVFKKYDSFCFSSFTDNLPTETENDICVLGKADSLKMNNIVSFRPEFYSLNGEDNQKKGVLENEKKNS